MRKLTVTGRTFLFNIARDSRHGCPLNPLLFALSLETLAQTICMATIYGTKQHISLYTDDVLLYVGNAQQSIPNMLSILSSFCDISGYRIN